MQGIECFLHIDKISSSDEISFLDNFLSNSFVEYFFVIAEVDEKAITPFKVLIVLKLYLSNLISKFFINQIGEKLTKKEFSYEKFDNKFSFSKSRKICSLIFLEKQISSYLLFVSIKKFPIKDDAPNTNTFDIRFKFNCVLLIDYYQVS